MKILSITKKQEVVGLLRRERRGSAEKTFIESPILWSALLAAQNDKPRFVGHHYLR